MTEAVTQRSQQRLNEWANRPGIGQGPLAKGAGAGMSRVAAAGRQVLGGALNTQTGQTLSGAAQGAWGVVQRAAPNLAAKTAVGASMTAQSVASGARSAARGASSGAGTVLQPSRTLGRAALHADARTFAARAANMDDDVPVQAGALGMDRMVEQHPLVRGVEQNMRLAEARMMAAAPGSPEYKQAEANYNASRAEYQMAANAARLQIGEQVGRAPHGGNHRYREARAAARRRDVRPQPNSYV